METNPVNQRIDIFAQHGWGFSAQSWSNYLADFAVSTGISVDAACPDRGYFGVQPATRSVACGSPGNLKVVIAHSLGLHLLPPEVLHDCRLLVAVSSFANFHLVEGRRTRALVSRMLAKLERQPLNVVRDFLHNAFDPAPSGMLLKTALDESDLNVRALRSDLMHLNESHVNLAGLAHIPNILLMHGTRDGIVNHQHAQLLHAQLPQSELLFIEGQGHALPFTNPLACHLALRQAIKQAARQSAAYAAPQSAGHAAPQPTGHAAVQ